jgi:hypothetical protein
MNWDSSVSKLSGYWLYIRGSILGKGRDFSLRCHCVQTGSEIINGYRSEAVGA